MTASTPGFTDSGNVPLQTTVPEASRTNRARSLRPDADEYTPKARATWPGGASSDSSGNVMAFAAAKAA